jgi:hypothetical protein
MTDFELLRDLRNLRAPMEPARDLWPQIAQQIAAQEKAQQPSRRRRWLPLASAASIAMAVTAGVMSLAMRQQTPTLDAAFSAADRGPSVQEQIQRARSLAIEGDPQLASAEVVLDAADDQLEQALQQQPDALFLVGLINRNQAHRRKLARLGLDAG